MNSDCIIHMNYLEYMNSCNSCKAIKKIWNNIWLSKYNLTEEINGNKCLPYDTVYKTIDEIVETLFSNRDGFYTRRGAHADDFDRYYPETTLYQHYTEDEINTAEKIKCIVEDSYQLDEYGECILLNKNQNHYDEIYQFAYHMSEKLEYDDAQGVYFLSDYGTRGKFIVVTHMGLTRYDLRYLCEAMYKGTTQYKNHTYKDFDAGFNYYYQKHYDEINSKFNKESTIQKGE